MPGGDFINDLVDEAKRLFALGGLEAEVELVPDTEIDNGIGKEYIYRRAGAKSDELLRLSTDLNKIGIEWDILVRNNTRVLLVSEPVTIDSEKYGTLSVTRVMAPGFKQHCIFQTISYESITAFVWAPTMFLFPIDKE